MSLSWDARGRAPLRKQGGQARRARSKKHKLLKNKNKNKAEADLPEVAEPIATNRRRESAAHLGACASNKDAFVCARKRVRAQIGQGVGRRRRGEPVVVVNLLFVNKLYINYY